MNIKFLSYLIGLFLLVPFQVFSDEEDRGGIEEITVTAEKEPQQFLIHPCQSLLLTLLYWRI